MRTAAVVCHTGLSSTPRLRGYDQVEDLYLEGPKKNVEIRLRNIEQKIVANLSPIARDLLEIASVLYVADTSIRRGETDVYGRGWQRQIHIVIPVRREKTWKKSQALLSEVVTYLSGDASITFDFRPHNRPRAGQGYLEFPQAATGFRGAKRIVLLSGGLDSLAGAAQSALGGEIPLLVSHRSVATRTQVQESLMQMLSTKANHSLPAIWAWVTRTEKTAVDNAQRLRSFLYMSLAAVIAHQLSISEVWYCENGITTFNLPLSAQRIGSRSTRTTHPRVVKLFERLCTSTLGINVRIDNPFLFSTKADILRELSRLNCNDTISTALSCTRTFAVEKVKRHCGVCFQCITRRFAAIAARCESYDPIDDYAKDIFTHSLSKGDERATPLDWVNFNLTLAPMSREALFHTFPQLFEAIPYCGLPPEAFSTLLYKMYQRNAEDTKAALLQKQTEFHEAYLQGTLAPNSLLGLIRAGAHLKPKLIDYAEDIYAAVAPRVREAFRGRPPANEKELQDQTEIILKAANFPVERESPQFAFSIVQTRPDFSIGQSSVFVEMKLLDHTRDRKEVVDGILADIPKYRTRCEAMLFVVYQTRAFITDADAFARELTTDPLVCIKVVG